MRLKLLAAVGLLTLCIWVPAVGVVACSIIIALQVVLMALRPVLALWPKPVIRAHDTFRAPVFSVHVATHSEPPAMVIRTLRALLNQNWPADGFEVIVMDNNTRDEDLWRPVEMFCQQHSNRLTFIHQLGVEGAKAGALNIALKDTRIDASHVVTVDADYVVHADFLAIAASALARTGADYVQFPQSYQGTSQTAAGVDAELEEYFRSNAMVADEAEAVLLTGTLCVISREALQAAGGWSGVTTTEDAELGVRLCNAGYSGRFINQIVGQGLLPFSLRDLEKQRYRWCSGNLQTLLRHLPIIFGRTGSLNLHKRLVVISQLTAWFNLALLPVFLLLAALLVQQEAPTLAGLAAASIVLSLLDITLRVTGRGLREARGLKMTFDAVACRLALAPRAAKATFDALLGKDLQFVVTDKSGANLSRACRGVIGGRVPFGHMVLFAVSFLALIGAQQTDPVIIAALLALMLPLPAAILTDISLRSYRAAIMPDHMEAAA